MSASAQHPAPVLVHAEELLRYSFGPGHPMGPRRVELALHLADRLDLLDGLTIVPPPAASDELLLSVHTPGYLAALRDGRRHPPRGIGTKDNPLAPGLDAVAGAIAAASVEATRKVWTGGAKRAVNLAGGLHHALPGATAGFCVYNDAAIAIRWLLDQGVERVAYLDLDVHHGDGVEQVFWDDPRVLTVSLHESGLHLFPHTGYPREIGGPDARGTAVNVNFPRATTDAPWLAAFTLVLEPVLTAFRPQIIVSQHGADAHRADPLADLHLSVDALAAAQRRVGDLADTLCDGRWVALGGGGYDRDATARVWASLLASVQDITLPTGLAMPSDWDITLGRPGSVTVGDRWHTVPAEWPHALPEVDVTPTSVSATARAVFPLWGLSRGAAAQEGSPD